MLLLVTIGLVLVAAVTLVIGFVSNSLPPIIVSIICSFLAAVVLIVFYRMNRRRHAVTSGGGPSPLVDTTPPVFSSTATAPSPQFQASGPVTGAGATPPPPEFFAPPASYAAPGYAAPPPAEDRLAGAPVTADQPRVIEPPVAPRRPSRPFRRATPEAIPDGPEAASAGPASAAPTEAPAAPSEPPAAVSPGLSRPEPPAVAEPPGPGAEAASGEWDDDLPFPIEDYDDLRVVEIIPLLPELDDQELEEVRRYEQANRKRTAIISRIDALIPVSAPPEPDDEGADAVEAAAPSGPVLPIADYDFLGVSEILPLLAELDAGELGRIRAYEESGRGRATLLYRIDSLLGTGAGPDAAPQPEAPALPEPEPSTSATAAPASASPEPGMTDYDKLRVFQILSILPELDADELQAVRDYEQARRRRITILNAIDARLPPPGAEPGPVAAAPVAPDPEPAEVAEPPQPAGDPVATAQLPVVEEMPPPPPALSEMAPESWILLPIAEYDSRAQGEILSLLDELDDDELEQIRDYEDANRARAAILFRIDALLAPPPSPAEPPVPVEEISEAPVPSLGGGSESEAVAPEVDAWGVLPIADYDELAQGDILPLLDELDDDELEEIRDYEESRRARVAILYRIDALLAAGLEPEADEEDADEESAGDALEPDLVVPEPALGQGAEPLIDPAELPIAEYDTLTVNDILPLLSELDDDELDEVRDYEDANLGRAAILAEIDLLLEPYEEDDAEAPPPPPRTSPTTTSVASAAPVGSIAPVTEDEAFEEADEYDDEEEGPIGSDDDSFPIADYDDLRVGEILPLLSQLQADELVVVARHEEQLANRSTVLNRIERLLRMSEKESST